MNFTISIIIWSMFLLALSPITSSACRLFYEPKVKFDRETYIFIGEVIGFTEKFEKVYGLKVKVLEDVNIPQKPKDHFEIFLYDISSDCARTIGVSDKYLSEFYPVGSKLIVSAEIWRISNKNKSGQSVLRIDNAFNNRWHFVYNLKYLPFFSVDSIFDYNNWDENYAHSKFELWKDLKRLEESSSDEEKIKIFERLIYLPKDWVDFEASVTHYIVNSESRLTLINKRKGLK